MIAKVPKLWDNTNSREDRMMACVVHKTSKALVGNSFPLSLVRSHRVEIDEVGLVELRRVLSESEVVSFWGHENSREVAESVLSVSLKPKMPRPAVVLDADGYPTLYGDRFTTCYILSPDYAPGYRPAIGTEVSPADILAWHALRLTWD